eukprot:5385835-Amphidinium_carterae.1
MQPGPDGRTREGKLQRPGIGIRLLRPEAEQAVFRSSAPTNHSLGLERVMTRFDDHGSPPDQT